MPRRGPTSSDIDRLIRRVRQLAAIARPALASRFAAPILFAVALAAAAGAVAWLAATEWSRARVTPGSGAPRAIEGFLFLEWNAENFYDDRDDLTNRDDMEDWYASEPGMFARKVEALASALLLHNEGRGPDVVALVEVESLRCVESLRDALNARLATEYRYTGVVHREDKTGRRFGPAVLTRLDVRDDLTRGARQFGNRRILEAHLESEGVPLVVLASHWTSRIRGEEATAEKRSAYAQALYARYLALRRETEGIDVILAGDFNDESGDPSLHEFLHAASAPDLVLNGLLDEEPKLLDLVARPDLYGRGTYQMKGRWEFLDHILAPPELLDPAGWSIRPETLAIGDFAELRTSPGGPPWKFGGPKQAGGRGYSDHFALSVRLVLGAKGP